MTHRQSAREYARVGLETGVRAATPHGIILMLFDGAIRAVAEGARHLEAGRPAEKGAAISRAVAIVNDGLAASLDVARGGDVARNLAELYDYVTRTLVVANARNDAGALAEVTRLLEGLRGAWAELSPAPAVAAPATMASAA